MPAFCSWITTLFAPPGDLDAQRSALRERDGLLDLRAGSTSTKAWSAQFLRNWANLEANDQGSAYLSHCLQSHGWDALSIACNEALHGIALGLVVLSPKPGGVLAVFSLQRRLAWDMMNRQDTQSWFVLRAVRFAEPLPVTHASHHQHPKTTVFRLVPQCIQRFLNAEALDGRTVQAHLADIHAVAPDAAVFTDALDSAVQLWAPLALVVCAGQWTDLSLPANACWAMNAAATASRHEAAVASIAAPANADLMTAGEMRTLADSIRQWFHMLPNPSAD
eukprot:6693308-Alexandrium_andersonii.AAC.1